MLTYNYMHIYSHRQGNWTPPSWIANLFPSSDAVLSDCRALVTRGLILHTAIEIFITAPGLGSITSRCSGKEPSPLPRTLFSLLGEGGPDTEERRKSSLPLGLRGWFQALGQWIEKPGGRGAGSYWEKGWEQGGKRPPM